MTRVIQSQLYVEILHSSDGPPVKVSRISADVLRTTESKAELTQTSIDTLYKVESNVENRLVSVEVLRSLSTNNSVLNFSSASIEILHSVVDPIIPPVRGDGTLVNKIQSEFLVTDGTSNSILVSSFDGSVLVNSDTTANITANFISYLYVNTVRGNLSLQNINLLLNTEPNISVSTIETELLVSVQTSAYIFVTQNNIEILHSVNETLITNALVGYQSLENLTTTNLSNLKVYNSSIEITAKEDSYLKASFQNVEVTTRTPSTKLKVAFNGSEVTTRTNLSNLSVNTSLVEVLIRNFRRKVFTIITN